ncbi:bifunctional 3,4-dihydroxy-2-butanone-4-phosphate synthase/GTP cyclohydrolase II [Gottschalkiaceae bacterium SANA]|nr:bifunctional 3,4-dihydroxy-2-butanone-4-phosphate synthase/GTP cyclohydrolase II [Gottschalkiaceae bacterium SANA]
MFAKIEDAIQAIAEGKMLVVVDDENRENEGDLLMAMEKVTSDDVNFMATWGRGLICAPMEAHRLAELEIPQMVINSTDPKETAFTVSVDDRTSITGISAAERARTLQRLADPTAVPADFTRPGHIFPLRAKNGGVLERDGHTEAAVDFARLAGLSPTGVICEIMKDDGTMARLPDLVEFAKKHELLLVSIADLIEYRKKQEQTVIRVSQAHMPTKYGSFEMISYVDPRTGEDHVALVKGTDFTGKTPLVRVHSECLTGDAFGSLRCDCGDQLGRALSQIEAEGQGVLVYLRQEGRGIGLKNKVRAYALQDAGMDTVDANLALGFEEDARDYWVGAEILKSLGASEIRLMTNNPEKIDGMVIEGVKVVERVQIEGFDQAQNHKYLATKRDRMGHILNMKEEMA